KIISHYLFQFENPFTHKSETYYYQTSYQLEEKTSSCSILYPQTFPNLEGLLELPKFPLNPPKIDLEDEEEI
ncbi:MAG TPA: hypothetical protein DCE71_04135, partial [Parachlamydiales bacterium]|nr:hypothetical protein [Parachlamydiales bacterium]